LPIDLPPIPDELQRAMELERGAPAPGETAREAVLAQVRSSLSPRRSRWSSIRARNAPNVAHVVAFLHAVAAIVIVKVPRTYEDPSAVRPLDSVPDNAGSDPTRPPPRPIPLGPDRAPVPASRTPILAPRIDLPLLPAVPFADAGAAMPFGADGAAAAPRNTRAEEDDVLRMTRMALAHDDIAAALSAIRLHIARYPFGLLAEEREMLAIEALVRAGRADQARARAEVFRHAYPESAALRVIDELVTHTLDAGQVH
jgi:hypothetical protein